MEKYITITPAYDKRNADPNKNFGIHNAVMYMVLRGELGAVVFTCNTGWDLPNVEEEKLKYDFRLRSALSKRGVALSYHSPVQLNDYETPHDNCEWIGKTCYGDVGYSVSDEIFTILVYQGSDAVWKYLEEYYTEIFKDLL